MYQSPRCALIALAQNIAGNGYIYIYIYSQSANRRPRCEFLIASRVISRLLANKSERDVALQLARDRRARSPRYCYSGSSNPTTVSKVDLTEFIGIIPLTVNARGNERVYVSDNISGGAVRGIANSLGQQFCIPNRVAPTLSSTTAAHYHHPAYPSSHPPPSLSLPPPFRHPDAPCTNPRHNEIRAIRPDSRVNSCSRKRRFPARSARTYSNRIE